MYIKFDRRLGVVSYSLCTLPLVQNLTIVPIDMNNTYPTLSTILFSRVFSHCLIFPKGQGRVTVLLQSLQLLLAALILLNYLVSFSFMSDFTYCFNLDSKKFEFFLNISRLIRITRLGSIANAVYL